MRTHSTCLALLTSLTLAITDAFAQGTAFTYQGQLKDGGAPASGVYDLRFTIYDAAFSGGVQGGPLDVPDIGVTNGLFTVTLDPGINVFTGAARWLEISVRPGASTGAYTNLTPRQSLTPTPYAIYAGGASAAGITGTISSNNIGAGSITTVMLAAGAVGANQLAAGAVTTTALAEGAVTAAKVATLTASLSFTTFTNPAPVDYEYFGSSVAAVGSDRVLIGEPGESTVAYFAGTAHLLSTDGTLITTFTNPTPAMNDSFGVSVAALGTDRVLIGAHGEIFTGAGAAYLFGTNSALLTTFTNPTPAINDTFGISVAALGADRVLIGAPGAGTAYLFNTNGARLMTFTNPTPAPGDSFGWVVAAVGTDRVLIGAIGDNAGASGAGAAYLFNTNGGLLTTFTNPTPAQNDYFGWSAAALGTDRVLIGAPSDTILASAGEAYLFSTSGALLMTFTNPTPAPGDIFGSSVAVVGSDWLLIGAGGDDTDAPDGGAAYLFSTNGALLTTLTNSTLAAYHAFGSIVAGLGTDRVLIGVPGDYTGAIYAGAAFLFSLETYTPGLVADGVNARSIITGSLEDGAVTLAKLDPAIGVWTRSGDNVFRSVGNVGIGTDTAAFTLEVNGSAGKPGGGSWSVSSDVRLKKNVRPLAGALDKLLALHGVNFEYIDPAKIHELSGERMGLLAQEVEKVFPDWVETGPDGYKRITVRGLEALLVEALRELQHKHEAESKRRDAETAELKQRLDKLEALLSDKLNAGPR